MPIYEYYCKKCNKTYEFQQRVSDSPKTACEVCKGPLKKQISLSTFQLKGSGWYATDYNGNKGNGKPSETPKKEIVESPAKEETKKETKKESSSADSGKDQSSATSS